MVSTMWIKSNQVIIFVHLEIPKKKSLAYAPSVQ